MAPKYTKTIICLANSRKMAGRCVAGKEMVGRGIGGWIRPVSARAAGELSEDDRRFENGQDPGILDVIRVPMIEPRPHGYQSENHLIDERYYWAKEGKATWSDVVAALDPIQGPLWDNYSSSYYGLHDRVEESTAAKLNSSLLLIRVLDLTIEVEVEGAEFGNAKRKVRGRFSLNGSRYRLSITDPMIERKYLAGTSGEFMVEQAVLCISLGEPYEGYAYKLIAGVILPV
jgi:hypothetical protein